MPQDATPAGKGVFFELTGCLEFAKRAVVAGQIVGNSEGDGVVVAQNSAEPGQGLLIKFPCGF